MFGRVSKPAATVSVLLLLGGCFGGGDGQTALERVANAPETIAGFQNCEVNGPRDTFAGRRFNEVSNLSDFLFPGVTGLLVGGATAAAVGGSDLEKGVAGAGAGGLAALAAVKLQEWWNQDSLRESVQGELDNGRCRMALAHLIDHSIEGGEAYIVYAGSAEAKILETLLPRTNGEIVIFDSKPSTWFVVALTSDAEKAVSLPGTGARVLTFPAPEETDDAS